MINDGEIRFTTKILSNRASCVKIQHDMPVPARNKNRFPWFLKNFNGFAIRRPIDLLTLWVDFAEPGYSFVSLFATDSTGDFKKFFCRVSRKETPSFMPENKSVPSRGAKWIDVNSRS